MTTRELILRSRAATYLETSIVAMTDAEYHMFLKQIIDFNYPRLSFWFTLYQEALDAGYLPDTELMLNYLQSQIQKYLQSNNISIPVDDYVVPFSKWIAKIHQFYQAITFQISDIASDWMDFVYEWWFCTPVGPQSCSRGIGDLISMLGLGRGDEWDVTTEIAIFTFQLSQKNYILLPTGYADAETIRRLRLAL